MILRKPEISDYVFVFETLKDWPLGDRGPTTMDKAISWTRRWIHRSDEICRIATDGPRTIGLVAYRLGPFVCWVDYLAVHPGHRGNGYSTQILRLLKEELVAAGTVVAEFKTLPGIIRDQIGARYVDIGDGKGRITWDMEL